MHDDFLVQCPNVNLNMLKRELPDQQPIAAFSLAWYASNSVQISTMQTELQQTPLIYGFYTTAKDDFANVVSVPLDQLLNLHKKYLSIVQVAETDPKHINQAQIQSVLQELFELLIGERIDNAPSKTLPRLTDPKGCVELECFLNAKFGAQTSNGQLRDWFIGTLRQSSNTLLVSTQD